MKERTQLIIGTVFIFSALLTAGIIGNYRQAHDAEYVCAESAKVIDGDLERKCAEMRGLEL